MDTELSKYSLSYVPMPVFFITFNSSLSWMGSVIVLSVYRVNGPYPKRRCI
jgi:hypothetical protein